jgi:hypothetical protein
MFGTGKLMRAGAETQALVLDKNAWEVGVQSGETKACTYKPTVQFPDGTTSEISHRVRNHNAARRDRLRRPRTLQS